MMKKRKIWIFLRVVAIAFLIAFFFRFYLFASYIVDGKSMEPTLYDGNLLMVNKMIYDFQDVDRFDVIVFHANSKEDYVKRVIGKAGDEIEYKDDRLYINDKAVEEKYLEAFRDSARLPLTKDFTLEELTGESSVPKGKLFVLGDNRHKSMDSRSFGFIDANEIVGKVDIRYWPMSELNFQFAN
ncbi:signal peptidase I [Saliterribacillus persicus]|uniref:Signal peptidase I n=2 Tax=Saliterribacillus persicus TaxID=930114 RepID=A0A368XNY0_9BACI|nr:signal peptidase I [Saliterribacillus persicus]